jgi:hypothetical protein
VTTGHNYTVDMLYRPIEFRSTAVKLYYIEKSKEKEIKVYTTLALAKTRPIVLIPHYTIQDIEESIVRDLEAFVTKKEQDNIALA